MADKAIRPPDTASEIITRGRSIASPIHKAKAQFGELRRNALSLGICRPHPRHEHRENHLAGRRATPPGFAD